MKWGPEVLAAAGRIAGWASPDSPRVFLRSVAFAENGDGLTLLATDSYRFVTTVVSGKLPKAAGGRILVQADRLTRLSRLFPGDVQVSVGDGVVVFRSGGVTAWVQLNSPVDVPDFYRFLADIEAAGGAELTFDKGEMLAALRFVRSLHKEWPVRLLPDLGGMTVEVVRPDFGSTRTVMPGGWCPFPLAFNPAFLAEAVAKLGDHVTFTGESDMRPWVARDESTMVVLMPVRIP